MENRLSGGLYTVMEWIARFVTLQFLWFVFTLAGIGLLGLFPATTAMFAVTRKWIREHGDIPLFQTFWSSYKDEFWKANRIGWITAVIGFILYFYSRIFQGLEGIIGFLLFLMAMLAMFTYGMSVLFLFPVLVHYRLKTVDILKVSVMMALAHPMHVIMMGVTLFSFVLLMQAVPGLLPFCSIGYLTLTLMWIANLAFQSKEKNQQF
ncbi:YesL family protein [Rossellomorea sp. NPDC077527]|uniref:YesL family protein n=1 Tax=Rossellomorea sp. NPDC077527 TaxID=3364510 RepID=UPI0037C774A7